MFARNEFVCFPEVDDFWHFPLITLDGQTGRQITNRWFVLRGRSCVLLWPNSKKNNQPVHSTLRTRINGWRVSIVVFNVLHNLFNWRKCPAFDYFALSMWENRIPGNSRPQYPIACPPACPVLRINMWTCVIWFHSIQMEFTQFHKTQDKHLSDLNRSSPLFLCPNPVPIQPTMQPFNVESIWWWVAAEYGNGCLCTNKLSIVVIDCGGVRRV